MKVAVASEENQIYQHFGKCPVFTVFSVEDGKITSKEKIDSSGNGHAALAAFLKNAGVDTVICGGIGEGAKNMLHAAGIGLVSGIEGNIQDAVSALLAGNLTDQGGGCDHHEHNEASSCDCEKYCR